MNGKTVVSDEPFLSQHEIAMSAVEELQKIESEIEEMHQIRAKEECERRRRQEETDKKLGKEEEEMLREATRRRKQSELDKARNKNKRKTITVSKTLDQFFRKGKKDETGLIKVGSTDEETEEEVSSSNESTRVGKHWERGVAP